MPSTGVTPTHHGNPGLPIEIIRISDPPNNPLWPTKVVACFADGESSVASRTRSTCAWRAISTGHGACPTPSEETDPSKSRRTALRPRAPMTIRSASNRSASATLSVAGRPSSRRTSTARSPARSRSATSRSRRETSSWIRVRSVGGSIRTTFGQTAPSGAKLSGITDTTSSADPGGKGRAAAMATADIDASEPSMASRTFITSLLQTQSPSVSSALDVPDATYSRDTWPADEGAPGWEHVVMSLTSAGRDLVGGGAHARAVEDVAADLAVDHARGLAPDALTERRERHGINTPPRDD